jgi:hypothetical protein
MCRCLNECSMAFRYTHRRVATAGTSARVTACVIPMAICRRARRPLDEAITAVADIRWNAVMARTWMFGMAAATRTGLCLGDFRTGLGIIDIDGRPRSGGVESARRKPRACSLHVDAVLARVRPLSGASSSGVSDCSGLARHRSQFREAVSWLRGSRNHLSGERNLNPGPAKTSGNERWA